MNSGPYSHDTDGSNEESGIKKMNPVLIRVFDDNKRKVSVQLLDLRACKEGTAVALFNNINSIVRENRVDWENCVVIGLDTGECSEKEFHHDTGVDEEQKYIHKWFLLPHNLQHCKQSSGTIFRSVTF